MNVLVYVPMLRLYGKALQSIMRLEWDGRLDITIVKGDDVQTPRDKQARFEAVARKYEHGRQLALAGDYDAMLCIEDDMIVPADTVQRLAAVDADVAYGLYCWRNSGWHKWNAYTELSSDHGTSLSDDRQAAQAAWGQVVTVDGIGQGCTFVHRRVLETITFHTYLKACSDWGLALDCKRLGFRQKCDLGVVCGHMTTDSFGEITPPLAPNVQMPPRIIWPDPDFDNVGRMYRVEYLA